MMTLKVGSRGPEVKRLQSALNLFPDGIFGPLTREGVEDFQRDHGLKVDGVAGTKTLAALGLVSDRKPRTGPRMINEIIIHCTDTPQGRDVSVDDVRHWHVDERGFSDIGYHFLIGIDGTVYEGRPLDIAGAHCLGHNAHSIGICYVGGRDSDNKTPKDTRTPSQKNALRSLVDYYRRKFGASVHGHYEFANKLCPCFTIDKL